MNGSDRRKGIVRPKKRVIRRARSEPVLRDKEKNVDGDEFVSEDEHGYFLPFVFEPPPE